MPGLSVGCPSSPFCGECGEPQNGRRFPLRPATFAVAPRERLELPLVTSSIFPQLAEKYRTPFRHGLFLVLTMLVAFSLLRLLDHWSSSSPSESPCCSGCTSGAPTPSAISPPALAAR